MVTRLQSSAYHAPDPAATVALGRELAQNLVPDDVVAFYGELGAGKTTMIKGVAEGLGVTETVKSPSFVIVTQYRGRLPVYHIDLYRIADDREADSALAGVDFEHYLQAGGICLIEWAERAEPHLPQRTIRVRLSLEGRGRKIEVTWPEQPQTQ